MKDVTVRQSVARRRSRYSGDRERVVAYVTPEVSERAPRYAEHLGQTRSSVYSRAIECGLEQARLDLDADRRETGT